MKFIACLITFVVLNYFAFSQNKVGNLLATLKAANTVEAKIDAYKAVVKHYQYSQPDSAAYFLNAALKEFKSRDSKKGVAAILMLMGYMDSAHSRLDMAKDRYMQALESYKALHDKKGMAIAHNGIGVTAAKKGEYADATVHFMDALQLFEALKDFKGLAKTYMRLGEVNGDNNNLDKALEYYNQALTYATSDANREINLAEIYNNIGIVYTKKGIYPTALGYYEKVLAAATGVEKTRLRIHTFNNIGILYDEMGDDKKALQYFDEAVKIAKDKNLPEECATLEVSRASVISKTNPRAAIAILNDALKQAKAIGLQPLQAVIYDNLVEIYEHVGDYKDAFETYGLLKNIDDSVFNIDKAKEIANLQAVHELEVSNARLTLSEAQVEANKLIRDLIIVIAVILAVLLVLVYFYYRKSVLLNRELKIRETDLQRSNKIKDRLFSIIGHDLRGPIGNVASMLQLLKDKDTSAEDEEYMLDNLMRHSEATIDTLDKLLYWGQSQIKGEAANPVVFAVGSYVLNNIELLRPSAAHKEIKIVNNIPADTSIYTDPMHFDFVLRNLLSNAVKFTHNSGIITLSVDTLLKRGFITFAVKDTGIGINPEKLNDIFTPFSSSSLGTNEEKGTSIGLMLCKEFVTENGGEIWVDTEMGKGSTFYFTVKVTS